MKTKKILSLLLLLSILLLSISSTAFGAEYTALSRLGVQLQANEEGSVSRLQLGRLCLELLGRDASELEPLTDTKSYQDLPLTSKDFPVLSTLVNLGVIVPDRAGNILPHAPASYHELLKVTARLLNMEPAMGETIQKLAERQGFLLYPEKAKISQISYSQAYATLEKASSSIYSNSTGLSLLQASELVRQDKITKDNYGFLSLSKDMMIFRLAEFTSTVPAVTITTTSGRKLALKEVRLVNFANALLIKPYENFKSDTSYNVEIAGELTQISVAAEEGLPQVTAVQRIDHSNLRLIFSNANIDYDKLDKKNFTLNSTSSSGTIIGVLPDYVYMDEKDMPEMALRISTTGLPRESSELSINELPTLTGKTITAIVKLP